MKLKKILASILAVCMVLGTMSFSAFAEETTTDRSIIMTPSKDIVSTGETFTVTISVSHESDTLKFASWDLTYLGDYFTYVSAALASPYTDDSVLVMNRNGNPLTPDVYALPGNELAGDIMVYTFEAKKKAGTDKPFEFESNNIRTGDDGWSGEDVTDKTEVTETDVTIEERKFTVTQLYDGAPVQGSYIYDTFDNQEHTFAITAELEDTDSDITAATITYTKEGEDLGSTAPTFKEAGVYEVSYTIEREGYTKVTETVKVEMKTAAFENVAIGFTTEDGNVDITSEIVDGTYEFPYDGSAHQLFVDSADTIDGSGVTITYSLNNGAATDTAPEITEAGKHFVTYTITAPNHTPINKTITVIITDPVKVVEVLLGEVNDYTKDNKMVLVYTDADNVSFMYDGAQMYDVSGGQYRYGDEKKYYKHVYALVVESTGVDNLKSYEDFVSVNYDKIGSSYVIDYDIPCDVNSDGAVNSNDIISAFTVLEGQDYAPMAGIIKLDNNFSKTARSVDDVSAIIAEVY